MSFLSDPRWGEALAHLPDYLGNHVRVSVTALTLGLAVSLPLAIIARNHQLLRGALLGLASIVQTVPGLALLALFYPLLLALAALSLSWFGFGFSAFGFLPAVLALALYSMLPVLRNTITGLQGVEPAILEAAQGVGMTPRQSLFTVELPLALPVMMAGIRTAAVWVIGTATLSTPIGQTSLGNYILQAAKPRTGCSCCSAASRAAVLALAVDQLLALIENRAAPAAAFARARRPRHRRAGGGNPGPIDGDDDVIELRGRRQNLYRTICAVGADRTAAACREPFSRVTRGARLQRDLRRAGGERYRRLHRLFRHAMGQPVSPVRYQAARTAA
jgi:ABC-type proline/glycine betaine transport system permease subunit